MFDTVTERVAAPLWPAESVAVAVSVWAPFATAAVFQVRATESMFRGTNLYITRAVLAAGSLCLTWTNTVRGAHYFVQGCLDLENMNWMPVSPTITAEGGETTWCVPLPTAYSVFRIAEGIIITPAGDTRLPINGIGMANGVFRFQWTGLTNQQYRAEWSPSLEPGSWNAFPGVITSSNGVFIFIDDGSQTGGLGPLRFYRFILLP